MGGGAGGGRTDLILFLKGLAQQIREVHLCDRFPYNRIVVHARACTPHAAMGHGASGLVAHGCFALGVAPAAAKADGAEGVG